jgi:septum formation protein
MGLVLASASPQRQAILQRLGVPFTVRPSGASELEQGEPRYAARENALRKARAAAAGQAGGAPADRCERGSETVLGVDTLVALDGRIYGKPADEQQARATLRALSGATHQVLSGVALLLDGLERSAVAVTEVSFRTIDEPLLEWYVAKGEWQGRAGGYAIQGAGAALVRELHGDYENVVGLPLAALLELYPELLSDR